MKKGLDRRDGISTPPHDPKHDYQKSSVKILNEPRPKTE
jgi:hypothetical protein